MGHKPYELYTHPSNTSCACAWVQRSIRAEHKRSEPSLSTSDNSSHCNDRCKYVGPIFQLQCLHSFIQSLLNSLLGFLIACSSSCMFSLCSSRRSELPHSKATECPYPSLSSHDSSTRNMRISWKIKSIRPLFFLNVQLLCPLLSIHLPSHLLLPFKLPL